MKDTKANRNANIQKNSTSKSKLKNPPTFKIRRSEPEPCHRRQDKRRRVGFHDRFHGTLNNVPLTIKSSPGLSSIEEFSSSSNDGSNSDAA